MPKNQTGCVGVTKSYMRTSCAMYIQLTARAATNLPVDVLFSVLLLQRLRKKFCLLVGSQLDESVPSGFVLVVIVR